MVEKNWKQGKEGLMVAVKEGTFQSVEKISNEQFHNMFTVRIKYHSITVRVIVIHAPQETDHVDTRSEFFGELAVQAERSDTAGDTLILLGDFNSRIGQQNDELVPISSNGRLLYEFTSEQGLQVANFSPKTSGVWTRIQLKDGTVNKSTIDYVLMAEQTLALMMEMEIDEEKIYCPYREKNTRSEKKIIFSDHCAIRLKLKIEPGENLKTESKYKKWHFTEEGYEVYKIESMAPMEVKWSPDTTQAYNFWTAEFEKTLGQCFSKKTVKNGSRKQESGQINKAVRGILSKTAKMGKVQREIVKKYQARLIEIETRQAADMKTTKLKQTMQQLTEQEKFSPNGYWKMKKAAERSLKADTVYSIVKDNGVEVSGNEAINQAYKDEFQHRLRTRQPHDGWEEYVEELNLVIREWLKTKSKSSPPFTDEELDKVISKLKRGKCPGLDDYPPELFINAGTGIRKALLRLFNQVKESRIPPEQWNVMKIVTIYKRKGSKKNLKYYRGIFLALVISKLFESLIKGRIDPQLQGINLLQAGSRTNRRNGDNLFLARGCIDHYVATN